MDAVMQALTSLRLERYARAFEELGWDDLEYMQTLDDEEMRGLVNDVGMKPGHASKFDKFLRCIGGRGGSSSALYGSEQSADSSSKYVGGAVAQRSHPAICGVTPLPQDPPAVQNDGFRQYGHSGPPLDAAQGGFGLELTGGGQLPAGHGPLFGGAAASSGATKMGNEMVVLEQGTFPPAALFANDVEGSDVDAGGPDLMSEPMKIPFGLDQVMKDSMLDQQPAAGSGADNHALMICNIPCSVTHAQLKVAVDVMGFAGQYDYVYLPEKRRFRKVESAGRTSNPGYGFISFSDSRNAKEFVKRFTGYIFPGTSSLKVCEVRRAKQNITPTMLDPGVGSQTPPWLGQPSASGRAGDEGTSRWGPPLATHLAGFSAPLGHASQAPPFGGLVGPPSQWAEPRWTAGTEADLTAAGAVIPGRKGEGSEFGDWWRCALNSKDFNDADRQTELETSARLSSSGTHEGQDTDMVPPYSVQSRPITTLMICNVPCSISQQQLSEAVDSMGYAGKYDFLYLPVKGRPSKSGQSVRRSNLGYGFIDFPCPLEAQRFIKSFTGYQFAGTTSVKRCEVRAAHMQGSASHQAAARTPSSASLPMPGACGGADSAAAAAPA
ncbi:unnamed protein product [Prorocentrum cordatum]|uniref:RRM domain-containing protein n=1 Tax=Prorocentrum cordatum TaxID=2364126 RepID=A0ABN9Q5Q9_9DINO|nr:unnamed protein product [Polarella glacialis]